MARIGRVLVSETQLAARVRELAAEVRRDGPDDLLLLTKLKGGVPFLADLSRGLTPAVEVDFLALSGYEEENPPGVARLVKDLEAPIAGRDVLVVEDVVDTGLSLAFLLGVLGQREPASLRVCTLVDRADKRLVDLPIAYRGFALGDEYLVGYGLDFLGLYRNLPCLVAVDDTDALRADPEALEPELVRWGIWTTRTIP